MITTRGGDSGETSLYSGERVPKDDPIFEVLGDVDELTVAIGSAKLEIQDNYISKKLNTVQSQLILLGGMTAAKYGTPEYQGIEKIDDDQVNRLELFQKEIMDKTPMTDQFVIPGKNRAESSFHHARVICRKAERHLVALIRLRGLSHLIPCRHYLNRLSDLLFVLSQSSIGEI